MRDRQRYHKLDEIGFVGVKEKRTAAEIRKEKIETTRSIKMLKAKRSNSTNKEP